MAPIQLSKFLIKKDDFERMLSHEIDFHGMTYDEFIYWNITCINELPNEDILWISGLCKRMKEELIFLQDMESCTNFEADSFYFTFNKKIVIVNPR